MQRLRRFFITGFFVIVPLFISVYALVKIFEVVDGLTTPLYDQLLHRRVPGLGTLTTVVVIFLTGVFATNVIGRRVLNLFKLRAFRVEAKRGEGQEVLRLVLQLA